MILIVIFIVILFGVAPFGIGNEPGGLDCVGAVQAADVTVLSCDDAGGQRGPVWGCGDLHEPLLLEQGRAVLLVNPQTGVARHVPLSPGAVRIVQRSWSLLEGVVRSAWHVERASADTGHRIAVYERRTGTIVLDVAFDRRIELSTAVVSSTGRFTVHVQANNIASEVTILDAQSGSIRRLAIAHDARLAAFAIGVAFSPNEACVAISMERVGGNGAETWLLDLESGVVHTLPVPDAFILGWARAYV